MANFSSMLDLEVLLSKPLILQKVEWPSFNTANVEVVVMREDLRHPLISGNKAWKLRHNLNYFRSSGKKAIISFGGAFSNHMVALSEICFSEKIPLYLIVRGEEQPANNRILRIREQGTHIHYCSRENYRLRNIREALSYLLTTCGDDVPPIDDLYVIPEGADNAAGVKGCEDLAALVPDDTDELWLSTGTGGTMEGVRRGLRGSTVLTGVTAVRNMEELKRRMTDCFGAENRWRLIDGCKEAGYGKSTPDLEIFMKHFSTCTGIPLEHTYTGKLFFMLDQEAVAGRLHHGCRIKLLHTGGYYQHASEC